MKAVGSSMRAGVSGESSVGKASYTLWTFFFGVGLLRREQSLSDSKTPKNCII